MALLWPPWPPWLNDCGWHGCSRCSLAVFGSARVGQCLAVPVAAAGPVYMAAAVVGMALAGCGLPSGSGLPCVQLVGRGVCVPMYWGWVVSADV
jgi:hypothetical protein